MKRYISLGAVVFLFGLSPFSVYAAEPTLTVPTDISVTATSTSGALITFSVSALDTDASTTLTAVCTPPSGALFALGTTTVSCTATSTINTASSTMKTFSAGVMNPPDTATFYIRDGATLLGPWTVTLPAASASPLSVTPNEGTTTPVSLSARSVLGALESLAATHSDFSVSDLAYYDFGAPYAGGLYLNCLTVPAATTTPLCSNWQFSVNGTAPAQGAGMTTLGNGDSVFLYYGTPRSVSLSSATVTAGTPFTATAQTYNPADNTFSPAIGVTIGVTEPDPSNPWSPIEIATSSVDGSGHAIFTLPAAGAYNVGIKEDYYSPTTVLTVVAATSAPAVTSGGAGGGGGVAHSQVNVAQALSYLVSQQSADGSFGLPFLADWAALAFVAAGQSSGSAALRQYLSAAAPSMGSVTDYERHAMALEALGINPYSGSPVDSITPIVRAFDGAQIGDASLDNDDIFALFPLLHAGYTTNDALIQKTVAFILSRQAPDGAWDASPDVTAAAVQALAQVRSLPNVEAALAQAETYLHSQQQSNGGFGNSFTTSWVEQAAAALGEPQASWTAPATGYYGTDYLAGLQQSDGGLETVSSSAQVRVWATEYAIPAALGKAWPALLQSFPKLGTSGGASAAPVAEAVTSATSTLPLMATSTPSAATSTPPVEPVSTSTPLAATTTTPAAAVASVRHTQTGISRPPKPVAQAKKPVEPVIPALTDTQTAAVASAPASGLLVHVWDSIITFFSRFL